jgi:hypothetical protein
MTPLLLPFAWLQVCTNQEQWVLDREKPMLQFIQRSWRHRRQESVWQARYDRLAPKVGDQAPDFELVDAAGERLVRLSDFGGRAPVALIFGSFT